MYSSVLTIASGVQGKMAVSHRAGEGELTIQASQLRAVGNRVIDSKAESADI